MLQLERHLNKAFKATKRPDPYYRKAKALAKKMGVEITIERDSDCMATMLGSTWNTQHIDLQQAAIVLRNLEK